MQFVDYEIVPLIDRGDHCEECDERNAHFFGLYGIDASENAYAIGDFATKEDAETIKRAIKGL